MLIRPAGIIVVQKFFSIMLIVASSEMSISIGTKRWFILANREDGLLVL